MNALLNAHTKRQGCDLSPHIGFAPDVLPEAQGSHTGVSSDYAPQDGCSWFALRATYNRVRAAYDKAHDAGLTAYVPMHHVLEMRDGKKKRVLQPLLPNLFFIYATRAQASAFVHSAPFVKYYLDKTQSQEGNGKHPPLTIPYGAMLNFIRATSTDSDHVRTVTSAQCRYKSGNTVRVTEGAFKGVVGKVARIAGQQRVVVEVEGLCLVATAYIPNGFIEVL